MRYRFILSILCSLTFVGVFVRADSLFVKGREKALTGDIRSEDAKGIVMYTQLDKKKADELFPAADILDVHYDDIKPVDLTLAGGAYKVAKDSERDANEATDPAKRKTSLGTALKGYGETLAKMQPHKFAKRTLEFKIALLTAELAVTEQASTANALAKLQAFKSANPSCWHLAHVMPMIAQIHLNEKSYSEAEATYQEMVKMEALPADMRLSAELNIVQVNLKAGNAAKAQKKIDELTQRAGKNLALLSRVNMARADILVSQKKTDEAVKLLKTIVKDSTDKQIKALAHNELGVSYFNANRYSDAVWEFLWVDAVFNQDRNQHARALYYLWKTFEQLNNAERAQECRETLLNDRQFTGTEYQRKAAAEAK
jgi:hypothetical protein